MAVPAALRNRWLQVVNEWQAAAYGSGVAALLPGSRELRFRFLRRDLLAERRAPLEQVPDAAFRAAAALVADVLRDAPQKAYSERLAQERQVSDASLQALTDRLRATCLELRDALPVAEPLAASAAAAAAAVVDWWHAVHGLFVLSPQPNAVDRLTDWAIYRPQGERAARRLLLAIERIGLALVSRKPQGRPQSEGLDATNRALLDVLRQAPDGLQLRDIASALPKTRGIPRLSLKAIGKRLATLREHGAERVPGTKRWTHRNAKRADD